jgi:ribosomal protein L25 (general stress protein Ctc)
MADTITLKAEKRKETGSKRTARLRREGKLPAVIYGHKQETTAISLDAHDFIEGLHRLVKVGMKRRRQHVVVRRHRLGRQCSGIFCIPEDDWSVTVATNVSEEGRAKILSKNVKRLLKLS